MCGCVRCSTSLKRRGGVSRCHLEPAAQGCARLSKSSAEQGDGVRTGPALLRWDGRAAALAAAALAEARDEAPALPSPLAAIRAAASSRLAVGLHAFVCEARGWHVAVRSISPGRGHPLRAGAPCGLRSALDMGCNEGFMLARLQAANPQAQHYGTDISPTVVAAARTRCPQCAAVVPFDLAALLDEQTASQAGVRPLAAGLLA